MNIVPFYPLRVLPSEDYFNGDLIYTFGDKPSTEKVKYFHSPLQLYKSLPKDLPVHCHGMTKEMIMLYILMFNDKRHKTLTPHTSFGKYPPWGFPVNLFPILFLLMKRFDKIRAISPYEFDYYQKKGLKQTYYEPLYVDKEYFALLGEHRMRRGVLCMGGNRAIKNVKTIINACSIAKEKLTIIDDVFPGSIEFNCAFMENDIFVNSSYMEGFPLGVAEAEASGMKLCLSNLPTLKSIYGERALYHEPDDYEKLAENINYCSGV